MLADVAVPTQHLDRGVSHFEHHFLGILSREHRGLGGILMVVNPIGRLPYLQARRLDFDGHIGEQKCDTLPVGDRLTKGLALLGVGKRVLVSRARLAHGHGGKADATDRQQAIDTNPLETAQAILLWNAHMV